MYVIVLGLFSMVVVGMANDRGPRFLQANTGPSWVIDLNNLLDGRNGAGLPQIGPLTNRQ